MEESTFLDPQKVIEVAHIEEGMRVADLGAGSGFFTRAAARAVGDTGEVWAVDIQRDMLSHNKDLSNREGLMHVHVVHGDIETLGGTQLPADHFDTALLTNVFFSAEHLVGIAEETRRILKKNGMAVLVDWRESFNGLGPHPDHVVSQEKVQKAFESKGFVFVASIPAGEYHWGVLVRKKI